MPTISKKGNVSKRCDCPRQNTCADPWYYYFGSGKNRKRGNLDVLIGFHPRNLQEAQREAKRAILALERGQDPSGLVAGDEPMLEELLIAYTMAHPGRDYKWMVPRISKTPMPIGEPGEPGPTRPFGEWRASQVTAATMDRFLAGRPTVAGNRDLALIRSAFNWAVLKDTIPSTPFRKGGVPTVKKQREFNRTRRLQPGEYDAILMAAVNPQIREDVEVVVETGIRSEELYSLQYLQTINHQLFLPPLKTKSGKGRRIPIHPEGRLRAILDSRRDPAGKPFPPDAYVFGDEAGRPIRDRKRHWLATKLLAHGIVPAYTTTGNLTAECRAQLRTIDLKFHDLRREAGSRWMDAGVPLATIQRWLGHANISQTSTYLGVSLGNDERDMDDFVRRVNARERTKGAA